MTDLEKIQRSYSSGKQSWVYPGYPRPDRSCLMEMDLCSGCQNPIYTSRYLKGKDLCSRCYELSGRIDHGIR